MTETAPDHGGPRPNWLGREIEVLVGPVAHGGHCVARHLGRVIFVRHTVPGERVVAAVTEDRGGAFCRADAVSVLSPSPDRVTPPCRYAHPGGCGGCDFQHVSLDRQRSLKADVVSEQLRRLAGLDWPVTVLALDGQALDGQALGEQALGWRRRIRFATTSQGQLGLHAHRSHEVLAIDRCAIGAPGVGDCSALEARWPPGVEVEVAVDDDDAVVVLTRTAAQRSDQRPASRGTGRRGRSNRAGRARVEQVAGPGSLSYTVGARAFQVNPAGFWQTHPRAATEFVATVLAGAQLAPGELALDLYAGAGLFTAALAGAVTETGRVVGLEGDGEAVADARLNLAAAGWAQLRHGPVTATAVTALCDELGRPDVIVADPPRTGVGAQLMTAMLRARPRTLIYVACDPAALARDVRVALDEGWKLADLTAFDAFPMTHHVECVAVLKPAVHRASPGSPDPVPVL